MAVYLRARFPEVHDPRWLSVGMDSIELLDVGRKVEIKHSWAMRKFQQRLLWTNDYDALDSRTPLST